MYAKHGSNVWMGHALLNTELVRITIRRYSLIIIVNDYINGFLLNDLVDITMSIGCD